MKIRRALIGGTAGLAVGLPLALQLMTPATASAMSWGPMIIAASPNSGPASGGTTMTITGDNLTMVTAVMFGNVPGRYTIVSNGEIIATSPAESPGTVPLQIKDGPRLLTSGIAFTYS